MVGEAAGDRNALIRSIKSIYNFSALLFSSQVTTFNVNKMYSTSLSIGLSIKAEHFTITIATYWRTWREVCVELVKLKPHYR